MELKDILSISGYSGLYKLISHAKSAIIVESFETKKRMPAYASSKISSLEDISVFTEEEDIKLADAFKSIYTAQNGGEAISHKSSGTELKEFFAKAIPNYDKDRVYVSDIKKIISWYNILLKQDLMVFDEEKEETPESADSNDTEPMEKNSSEE
ncbi:MAG: DUF5606 domain-containing protein [Bacteroidetes bacterium]|jgi:hypothetical protein|nr:DUF5606 domain-containing protein [Bacteroidota bacterium]MBT6685019.1 DUF5606 domain-containing protein [Bacteroidota bacterium]MBT7143097.1 DUF5606 domain-containing protein [Bacteroidota bacterium]MBT7491490.1 DUF5606 domain-containing protein [Bacteroidota bacterium]